MANGGKFDPKELDIVIDDYTIPKYLFADNIKITPPQNRSEVVGGVAGGWCQKINNSVDAMLTISLYPKDYTFTLEQKYLAQTPISVYVKDLNTQQNFGEPSINIQNMSEITLGSPEPIEFEIPLPTYVRG